MTNDTTNEKTNEKTNDMTTRLRLMKVLIQPVFIADDGENLTEVALANEQGVQGPIPVSAAEWPGYADTLERQRQEHEERMNAEAPVAANRQQRRAAQRAKVNGKGE